MLSQIRPSQRTLPDGIANRARLWKPPRLCVWSSFSKRTASPYGSTDVHPVVLDDARGRGIYRMEGGVHDNYELEAKDFRELELLRACFGVDVPQFRRSARSGSRRSRHVSRERRLASPAISG